MAAEGWYADPYGAHEERWYSDGWPTSLVRDAGVDGTDAPPPGERREPTGDAHGTAGSQGTGGSDLVRADDAIRGDQSFGNDRAVTAALVGFFPIGLWRRNRPDRSRRRPG
jgi:hypothetical protein